MSNCHAFLRLEMFLGSLIIWFVHLHVRMRCSWKLGWVATFSFSPVFALRTYKICSPPSLFVLHGWNDQTLYWICSLIPFTIVKDHGDKCNTYDPFDMLPSSFTPLELLNSANFESSELCSHVLRYYEGTISSEPCLQILINQLCVASIIIKHSSPRKERI